MKHWKWALVWAVAAASVMSDRACRAAAAPAAPDVRRDATVAAVERVLPSVVNISTLSAERADPYEQMLRDFFGYGRRAPDTMYSSGSGVVIDEEGWVLTNFHVVRDAARVQVTLAEASDPLEGDVISVSEANDLTLIRLKSKPGQRFRAVPFASDEDLLLGETVLALGNPYGLGGSVSRGILSSKTRRAERDGEPMEPEDWLQTDASINPGNSGGPLVNLKGELIGLNVAILARAQGIGFAIPIKRIHGALVEMCSPEALQGLWFGASVRGTHAPVVVTEVQRDSPAEAAGLEPGDEVVSVNGKAVRGFLEFYRELGRGSGKTARCVVQRGEARREVKIALVAQTELFNAEYFRKRLGAVLEPVSEEALARLRLPLAGALMVMSVDRGSPAERAGLEKGQVVKAVDGQAPGGLVPLGRYLQRKRAGESVTLSLIAARRRGMILQLSEGRAEVRLR